MIAKNRSSNLRDRKLSEIQRALNQREAAILSDRATFSAQARRRQEEEHDLLDRQHPGYHDSGGLGRVDGPGAGLDGQEISQAEIGGGGCDRPEE